MNFNWVSAALLKAIQFINVVLVYFTALYTTDDAFGLIAQCSLLHFHVLILNSVLLFVFLHRH